MLANQPITPGSSLRGSLLPVPDRPFGGAETSPVPRGLVAVMWPNHVHLSCGLSGSPGCSPPGRTADAVTLELHPLSGPECLRPRTSEGCAAARRTRADTPVRLPMGGIMAPPLAKNFVPEIKGRCMSLALTWGTGVVPLHGCFALPHPPPASPGLWGAASLPIGPSPPAPRSLPASSPHGKDAVAPWGALGTHSRPSPAQASRRNGIPAVQRMRSRWKAHEGSASDPEPKAPPWSPYSLPSPRGPITPGAIPINH